jgi:hypothetical protein
MTTTIIKLSPASKTSKETYIGTMKDCLRLAFANGYEIESKENNIENTKLAHIYLKDGCGGNRTASIHIDRDGFFYIGDL